MHRTYQIITDATADMVPEMLVGLPEVQVIPMGVTLGEKAYTYGPGGDITVEEFYAAQRDGKFATTSQINPTVYLEYFEACLQKGEDVLSLCLTSGVSGTFQTASLCAAELQEKYPEGKVICIDSLCASVGEGFLVREAARKQKEGLTLDELLTAAGSATGQAQELAFLPRWETKAIDLHAAYAQRMSEVGKKGYGMFARHHVFALEDGHLVPVRYPDPQRLSELPGYEQEREKVIANTRALLAGMPANNVLLYGDAGTGKSSAVKAIANEFAPEGLRLVEVKKNQLYQIPDLMDKLAANPLKFILFIDDLSFTANDDNFAALKAILEGSVGGRAKNIAVYATSNRRHLIKETLTDRTGDDIHEADTRQELMSLSARFGLTITFQRPEKARFETILAELAKQHGIDMPMDQLLVKAEAFAIRAGGRSPRVAKQFIEQCEAGVQK